jgi:hypothetical protein
MLVAGIHHETPLKIELVINNGRQDKVVQCMGGLGGVPMEGRR